MCDYLDELVPANPLHPKDPMEKAQQRLRADNYKSEVQHCSGGKYWAEGGEGRQTEGFVDEKSVGYLNAKFTK